MKRVLLFVPLLVVPTLADCVDGSRPATEDEKKFTVMMMTALKSALPPAPAGWKMEDRNRILEPVSYCAGSANQPHAVSYQVTYYWLEGAKVVSDQTSLMARRIAEIRQLPPDVQQQYDDLSRESRELAHRRQRTLAARNTEEAARLDKQSRELSAKAAELRRVYEQSIQPKVIHLVKEMERGIRFVNTQVLLTLYVNQLGVQLNGPATKLNVPGAVVAARTERETVVGYGEISSATRVVGGNEYTEVTASFKPGCPLLAPHNVIVRVSGSPQQVDLFLSGIQTHPLVTMLR